MNEVSFASKMWGDSDPTDSTGAPAADMGDAADFQQWLQTTPLQTSAEAGSSNSLGEILRSASVALHEREHVFDKTLKRATRTADPMDGLAVQHHLSELYLSHGLAVKVIGKTTQAMDQLLRLQ